MSNSLVKVLLLLFTVALATVTGQTADPCSASVCQSPSCVCSGWSIPYNWSAAETPQLIALVFEGSLNDVTFSTYYEPIFSGLQNANGCPVSATFFIDHKYTDYTTIRKVWSEGFDFGVQSVTGASWSSSTAETNIYNEVAGEKYYLELFGQVQGVQGLRAPAGVSGGDAQFEALSQAGLLYDNTLISRAYGSPYWPYTLDYKTTQDCNSGPCPSESFPGIWEFPITDFIDGNGVLCSNLFSCIYNNSMYDAYSLLTGNYQYHLAQATPFIIPIPQNWLFDTNNTKGLNQFLTEALGAGNTYVLTMNQALAWLQAPVKADQAANFEPWGCDNARPSDCSKVSCKYTVGTEQVNFNFCSSANATNCPSDYPWVDNLPWSVATFR